VEYYDSKGVDGQAETRIITGSEKVSVQQFLKALMSKLNFEKENRYVYNKAVHQTDHHNCGVFTCDFIRRRLAHQSFKQIEESGPKNIQQVRYEMASKLLFGESDDLELENNTSETTIVSPQLLDIDARGISPLTHSDYFGYTGQMNPILKISQIKHYRQVEKALNGSEHPWIQRKFRLILNGIIEALAPLLNERALIKQEGTDLLDADLESIYMVLLSPKEFATAEVQRRGLLLGLKKAFKNPLYSKQLEAYYASSSAERALSSSVKNLHAIANALFTEVHLHQFSSNLVFDLIAKGSRDNEVIYFPSSASLTERLKRFQGDR